MDHITLKDLEKQIIINKHQKRSRKDSVQTKMDHFVQGDNVQIIQTNEFGIVYKGPDGLGNYIVQVKGEKVSINQKRMKLYIAAKELYPDDYDFDIIFQSKENRKKSTMLSKKHVEDIVIDHQE
ncbi:hypothetical protein RCG23_21940 [Neobacillus sp. PS3-34]|uniref:hypothetical protein n=1 Tax=Neobacillus sp. PS3-34 TaxID=3070678 RepID=UPI0027E1A006|nr:hypothetical protein [Neobacillus sp. PS3-34]WML47941.1 hypothetical protein RCG23_21940 [Neobacillus sp. PS3-34]